MGDNWDWDPEKVRAARQGLALITVIIWICDCLATGHDIAALVLTGFLATVTVAASVSNNRRR